MKKKHFYTASIAVTISQPNTTLKFDRFCDFLVMKWTVCPNQCQNNEAKSHGLEFLFCVYIKGLNPNATFESNEILKVFQVLPCSYEVPDHLQ